VTLFLFFSGMYNCVVAICIAFGRRSYQTSSIQLGAFLNTTCLTFSLVSIVWIASRSLAAGSTTPAIHLTRHAGSLTQQQTHHGSRPKKKQEIQPTNKTTRQRRCLNSKKNA
jgi:hypothetical protein